MAEKENRLICRVHGSLAPEGTPEREYWTASVRYGIKSEQFRAAAYRMETEGCPPFTADYDPVWDGERWALKRTRSG